MMARNEQGDEKCTEWKKQQQQSIENQFLPSLCLADSFSSAIHCMMLHYMPILIITHEKTTHSFTILYQ